MKQNIRHKAQQLRQKGLSLSEISKKLNIAKSTASLWVRNVELNFESSVILDMKGKRGLEKAKVVLAEMRKKRRQEINDFAQNIVSNNKLSNENLFMVLSLVYYCEGVKNESEGISFTNSDAGLLKFFVDGCRKVFGTDEKKWRANMHLHSYHNEDNELKFWSKTLRIPIPQFQKTFHKKNSGLFIKDGYRGCVRVKYARSDYSKKLLAIAKELFKKGL